jgi:hypothetical protein
VFGCSAYVHADKSQRRKLDDRAWKGVFVGYAPESPALLVHNPATRRVVSSRNVVLDESAIISMGESCPAREMLDAEVGDDITSDEAAREKPDTFVGRHSRCMRLLVRCQKWRGRNLPLPQGRRSNTR